MSDIVVGDRVLYNNLKGTVEFAGTTAFSAGTWYGVKLDLPKGKNDGTVNGKLYFKCEKNHGIFVRISQLSKLDTNDKKGDDKSKTEDKPKSGLRKPTAVKAEGDTAASTEEKPKEVIPEKKAVVEEEEIEESEENKSKIQDLEEKLQTLQIKRSEDKEKLKEYDKIKIHVQQLEENKKHIQEKAAEYQRALDKMKQDYSKLNDEFEVYKEETSSLSENIEMLTIDKEMAEEKLDGMRIQLDELNARVEELTLENEILKLEQKGVSTGTTDEAQLNMFKSQNNKLRDAIIVMRDLSEGQKAENERVTKELSKLETEYDKTVKERNRLAQDLKEAQENIIELKEQVDSALGADEMVSALTDKNLDLEERLKKVFDEKVELEELCDMNNEINENNTQMITELQSEIDMHNMNIQELNKALVSKNECIIDYEETIEKFRELVKDLQQQIKDYKQQIDNNNNNNNNNNDAMNKSSTTNVLQDFRSINKLGGSGGEIKEFGDIIETEFLKLENSQYSYIIELILKFLPNQFFKSGNGSDSIFMVNLTNRLIGKIDILLNQIKNHYVSKEEGEESEESKKIQDFMPKLYFNKLCYLLNNWFMILRHFKKILSTSQMPLFSRLVSLYSEMSPNEKSIDYIVDLLKKGGNIDRPSALEPLERTCNYFNTFYQVHVSNEMPDCNEKLIDIVKVSLAAVNMINEACSILYAKYDPQTLTNREYLDRMQKFSHDLSTVVRNIRRHSMKDTHLLFSKEVSQTLDQCLIDLTCLVNVFMAYCSNINNQLEENPELTSLPSPLEVIRKQSETKNVTEVGEYFTKLDNFYDIINNISESIENGKFDSYSIDSSKKSEEPVVLMATKFKNELTELEGTCSKLDQKDDELRQAKINYKMKCDEISEMTIRLGVTEKKLNTFVKEKDEIIERLEQKYEQTKASLIKKERELDQTSEALQSDINNLEAQKDELKKQIKENRKRNLFDNINVTCKNFENNDGQFADIENLLERMKSLRQLIQVQRKEIMKLQSQLHQNQMSEMNLTVPKKPKDIQIEETENIKKLSKQFSSQVYDYLSSVKIAKVDENMSKVNANCILEKEKMKQEFDKIKKLKITLIQNLNADILCSDKSEDKFEPIGLLKFKSHSSENQPIKTIHGSVVTINKINNYFM